MGVSTNGNICFGIIFDEDFEFPWGDECFDDWYVTKHLGMQFAEYRDQLKFIRENPIPFELENYCSDGCEMFILAVPGTVKCAHRGYPEKFVPSSLLVDDSSLSKFNDAIKSLEIDCGEEKPEWILYSYMG